MRLKQLRFTVSAQKDACKTINFRSSGPSSDRRAEGSPAIQQEGHQLGHETPAARQSPASSSRSQGSSPASGAALSLTWGHTGETPAGSQHGRTALLESKSNAVVRNANTRPQRLTTHTRNLKEGESLTLMWTK